MQGKHVRDTINSLEIGNQQVVTKDEDLVQAVQDHFATRFTTNSAVLQNAQERREVMSKLDPLVTAEQNDELLSLPDNKEITVVVSLLKKEKSSGIDGLTSETLQICWDFIKVQCCQLVRDFWQGGSLPKLMLAAIIKLLYKGGKRAYVKNWWPISLLNVPYKLVAKLIANRLKGIVPGLVDAQQTVFIQGRHLQDNVLTMKFAQELAQKSKTPIAMFLIDFSKAYDQIEHFYLWETMSALGFAEEFLDLIRGLVVPGTAKVHFNGLFTQRFALQRGVRQGCPLAPLLYSISTQPLMVLFNEKLKEGCLKRPRHWRR
jgi:hypothetical protein